MRSLLANDRKGTRSCCRPHHPPGIQSGSPAVSLQRGPFERPANRYGHCGLIGCDQNAVFGVETAPLCGESEIAKKHDTGPRNAYGARGVAGPATRGRHRSGRLVNDHHQTTERHTPQPARVSIAELRSWATNCADAHRRRHKDCHDRRLSCTRALSVPGVS